MSQVSPEEIKAKLSVIRSYLEMKFPNHEIREGREPNGADYSFAVQTLDVYKLQVARGRIEDRDFTTERLRSLLFIDNVARRMQEAKGEPFLWETQKRTE
jgi:hypothetical protein